MRYWIFCFLFGLISFQAAAQPTDQLSMYVSMDLCDFSDDFAPAKPTFSPELILCTCGPEGNALQFNGVDNIVSVLDTGEILPLAFSLSFYFKPSNEPERQTIVSYANDCNAVKGFYTYFDGNANVVSVEFSESLGKRILLSGKLNSDCWNHILVERNGERHALHIDGVKVDEQISDGFLDISNPGLLTFGFGPCVPTGFSNPLAGALDEVRLYERTLRDSEIQSLLRQTNQIITRDTIIFLGDGFNVNVNAPCAFVFDWSPSAGVSSTIAREPFLSPTETTVYSLDMEEIDCIATDSLRVIVVDPSEVQCDQVLLPTAFTPNDDGLNDEYFISNGFIFDELIIFEIFDRLGSRVFATDNINEGWDGRFRGQPVMPGVYVYKVKYICEGEEQQAAGSFSVLR